MEEASNEGIPAEEPDFEGQELAWMPKSSFDGPLRKALVDALPPGVSYSFNIEGDQAWVCVSKPADTHQILQTALSEIGRA